MAKKTTSVVIDEDIWKQFKSYCVLKDIELGNQLENMIKKELQHKKCA